MPGDRLSMLLTAVILLAPAVATAEVWPTRPVTIVSPFAAGSGIGLLARNVGNDSPARSDSRS